MRAVAVAVARRGRVSGFSGVIRSHAVAFGEASSANEFSVAEGRVEVRCGLAVATPARGDLRDLRVVEALGLWPDASVEDSDNDVV